MTFFCFFVSVTFFDWMFHCKFMLLSDGFCCLSLKSVGLILVKLILVQFDLFNAFFQVLLRQV